MNLVWSVVQGPLRGCRTGRRTWSATTRGVACGRRRYSRAASHSRYLDRRWPTSDRCTSTPTAWWTTTPKLHGHCPNPPAFTASRPAVCAAFGDIYGRLDEKCMSSEVEGLWARDRPKKRKLYMKWSVESALHTHTHPFNGPFSRNTQVSRYQKGKTNLDLLKQETVSGSGISWAICKSASHSRQTTMPAPHRSVFYRPDALPATQPTASKHWRHLPCIVVEENKND